MIIKYKIFTDFDGTITQTDSLEYILNKHVGTRWQEIEKLVSQHKISEIKALQNEFDFLNLDLKQALHDLKEIRIDPYFKEFLSFCKRKHIPVTILSGGFDIFIKTILAIYDIHDVCFNSNSVTVEDNRWKIIPSGSPKIKNKCNHCKSYWLEQAHLLNYKVIYIGDGNTDRCPAKMADIRFAKGNLATYLESINLSFFSYHSFLDIIHKLTCNVTNLLEKEFVIASF